MDNKQPKPNLTEVFAGLVYDMFRAAGTPISINNQEKVENIAPRFADAIRREAREAALTLAKRLQQATLEGFNSFSKEVDALKDEVKELKNEVKRLSTENARAYGDGK